MLGIIRYVKQSAISGECFGDAVNPMHVSLPADTSVSAPPPSLRPLLVGFVTTVGLGTIPGHHISIHKSSVKSGIYMSASTLGSSLFIRSEL